MVSAVSFWRQGSVERLSAKRLSLGVLSIYQKVSCIGIVSQTTVSLVEAAQKMVAMKPPVEGHHQSVQNYMYNHQPLPEKEAKWIHEEGDLIALKKRIEHQPGPEPEHAWLDLNIERLLAWLPHSLVKVHFPELYISCPS